MQLLKPDQWQRLTGRLGEIENPEVPTEPSESRCPTSRRSRQRRGGTGSAPAPTDAWENRVLP